MDMCLKHVAYYNGESCECSPPRRPSIGCVNHLLRKGIMGIEITVKNTADGSTIKWKWIPRRLSAT